MSGISEVDITKNEFISWLNNKTTQEVLKFLKEYKEDATETLQKGGTIDYSDVNNTAQRTNDLVGYIRGLDEILCIEWEDEEVTDDETQLDEE